MKMSIRKLFFVIKIRLGQLWEWSTSVTITREGDFTRSGRDDLDEIQIFKGDENTLTMRQTYTHKFHCVYILDRYPFDTQVGGSQIISKYPCCRSVGLRW